MFQNTILKGIVFIPWLLGILELCPLICWQNVNSRVTVQ
jgi:hypothetical protein